MTEIKSQTQSSALKPSQPKKTGNFLFILRIAITVLIFSIVLSKVDRNTFFSVFTSGRLDFYFISLIALFFRVAVSAMVTQSLLVYHSIFLSLRKIIVVNYLSCFSSALGIIAGGLVRWHELSSSKDHQARVFSVIISERFLVVSVYGALFCVTLGYRAFVLTDVQGPWLPWFWSGVVLTLCFSLVHAVCFFSKTGDMALRCCDALSFGWLRPVSMKVKSALESLILSEKNNHSLGRALIRVSLLIFTNVLFFKLVFMMFGVSLHMTDHLWIVSLVSLGQMVPITVFGLGVREGILIYGLGIFGFTSEAAISCGFIIFFGSLFNAMIGGIIYVLRNFGIYIEGS